MTTPSVAFGGKMYKRDCGPMQNSCPFEIEPRRRKMINGRWRCQWYQERKDGIKSNE